MALSSLVPSSITGRDRDHDHSMRPSIQSSPPPSPPPLDRRITRKKSRRNASFSVEEGLSRARSEIRRAALAGDSSPPHSPNTSDVIFYHNPRAFCQSYNEMEKRFKVYVYTEGDAPMFHQGPCKDIYTSEGRSINEIENRNQSFRTRNPLKAHAFFLLFSVTWMVQYVYEGNSYNKTPMQRLVSDYLNLISRKYPFWNRSGGA